MRKRFTRRLALSALAVAGILIPANAVTITFDGVPSVGNPQLTTLNTQGFNFTSEHFHTVDNPTPPLTGALVSDNTPVYIAEEGGNHPGQLFQGHPVDGKPITMALTAGGSFTLNSFDGAEFTLLPNADFPNANLINVLGNLTLGGTVTASFQLDGLKDGPGGIPDFQTFVLPPSFTGLSSVVFSGALVSGAPGGLSLDNIVVNESVPEGGATLALLGMGLSVLGFKKRAVR